MKDLLRENYGEAAIGVLVVLLAAWFFTFAWHRTGGGAKSNAIHVVAMFPNAAGVNLGTEVRVAGLKVGTVSRQELDTQTFQVKTTLAIDPSVKVPADSSAAITSEGLLGSPYIALLPGGETTPLKNGDTITDTQGSVDLMSLVGQFVNKSGGASSGAKAEGNGQTAAPAQP